MKNTTLILAGLSLFLSTAAVAQKMQASPGTPMPRTGEQLLPKVNPATPVAPLPGKTPSGRIYETNTTSTDFRKNTHEEQILMEQKVSPQLKNADGVIRIDFGVARQGENFTTFFPFNITTLENVETVNTPTLNRRDYLRYVRLNNKSDVTDVKLVSGKLLDRNTQSVMKGNGFDLEYTASRPGAVDELVEVYTQKGNLVFRLTGYVAAEGTEMSMK